MQGVQDGFESILHCAVFTLTRLLTNCALAIDLLDIA